MTAEEKNEVKTDPENILKACRWAAVRIEARREELSRLEAFEESHPGSRRQLLKIAIDINREIEQIQRRQLLGLEAVGMIKDSEARFACRLHYIDGMKWEQVAAGFGYCDTWIYAIRRRALDALRNL